MGYMSCSQLLTLLQRRLFRSDKIIEAVDAWQIEGKAYVVHPHHLSNQELQEWLSQDDHFYVDMCSESARPYSLDDLEALPPHGFKPCKTCHQARLESLHSDQDLHLTHQPLNGLELFAGAGGLSTGFDYSGFIQTKWAVEMDANAALSYM